MSDVDDRFRVVSAEVATVVPPSPADVRRRAERARAAGHRLAVAALVVTLAGGVVAAVALGRDGEPDTVASVDPTPSATAVAWLPEPWTLTATSAATWSAGTAGVSYRFCDHELQHVGQVDITIQSFTDGRGRQARLTSLRPHDGDTINLFKFSYASCVAKGGALSVAGPRNLWSFEGTAGAAEVVGDSLHVVELMGSTDTPRSRNEAAALLDAWES